MLRGEKQELLQVKIKQVFGNPSHICGCNNNLSDDLLPPKEGWQERKGIYQLVIEDELERGRHASQRGVLLAQRCISRS